MLPLLSTLALCSQSAAGGSLVLDVAPLTGAHSGWTEAGVGAPGVDLNTRTGRWVMTFESQVAPPTEECPHGSWAVGAAVSSDGATWTPISSPVVAPLDKPYLECGARHPTPLWLGDTLHVWFTALGPSGLPRGIAHGSVSSGRFVHDGRLGLPHVGATEPSVSWNGAALEMVFVQEGQLHTAVAPIEGSWEVDATPTLLDSSSWWSTDGLYSPSLSCRPESSMPHVLNYVGVVGDGGDRTVTWSYAIGESLGAWYLSWTPLGAWTGHSGWRSLDVLHAGDGSTVVWYEAIGDTGRPEIHRFTSDGVTETTEFQGHACGS